LSAWYTIYNASVCSYRDKLVKKREKRIHPTWPIVFIFLGVLDFGIFLAYLLKGTDVEILHPTGLRAQQQFHLIEISTAVLLAIAIPSLFLFYFFAWKYRETNEKATYDPDGRHSKYLVLSIWAIPSFVMVIMACIMWTSTHKLDPHTPISAMKPLTIEVVAMRWKWLFIYPDQNIATVNYVQIPTAMPVKFDLTADEAPMSSFWIPHLSGQLYAMTGHVNALNIRADIPGDYKGSSAEINGAGFADMKFTTRVGTQNEFDQWVQSVQSSNNDLNADAYADLLKPSESNSPKYYSNPQENLYAKVVEKYGGAHTMTQSELQ
jgi:cytochrome o ubiquinol oxidase subunit 2